MRNVEGTIMSNAKRTARSPFSRGVIVDKDVDDNEGSYFSKTVMMAIFIPQHTKMFTIIIKYISLTSSGRTVTFYFLALVLLLL